MSFASCSILSVPDEVVVGIVCFCNWKDVLALEQTCKALNRLCSSRPVWRSLLGKLESEESPCLPPHISVNSLSTSMLRETVLGGLRNKRLWDSDADVLRPTHVKELRLPTFPDPTNSSEWMGRMDVRLLPGGKQVLVENRNVIELWSVDSSLQLGTTPVCSPNDMCLAFDSEMTKDGTSLSVAAVFINTETCQSCVRVFSFDCERQKSELLLERGLPFSFIVSVAIRNDVVLTQLPHEFGIILVNWKTGESVLVDFRDSAGRMLTAQAVLVGQNIIIALDASEPCLTVLPLPKLDGLWSPSLNFNEWAIVTYQHAVAGAPNDLQDSDMQNALLLNKLEAVEGPWVLALHAFMPSWRGEDALPEVLVVAFGRTNERLSGKRLLAYRAQLLPATDSEGHPQQRLKLLAQACSFAEMVPWDLNCITNGGRMFELWNWEVLGFSLFASEGQVGKKIDFGAWPSRKPTDREPVTCAADPYSGALAIGTPGLVRIYYFN